MPTAATSALEICSRASLLIGSDAITSFSDGTVEADVANAVYEDIVITALTSSRWRFATRQEELVRYPDQPVSRWDAAYEFPTSLLMLSTVTVADAIIEYDIYGNHIYCNASPNQTVVADYIYRANETLWPAYFVLGVQYKIASALALSAARDMNLSQMMEQQSEIQMIKARRLDSQQQTTRKLNTSGFIAQRRS